MAHIVTLNNGKKITMSVATDESLWSDLSYYIRRRILQLFNFVYGVFYGKGVG